MNTDNIIALISAARYKSTEYIKKELRNKGIEDLRTSIGNLLSILYRNKGIMQISDICKSISRSKSTVTEMINKAEKLGYVKRIQSQDDKRIFYVELTKKAYLYKKDFDDVSKKLIMKTFKRFSQEEKETLVILLKKMIDNF